MGRIASKGARLLASWFPSIYEKLVSAGLVHEAKWVDLKLGHNGKASTYLKDDHRNRTWFCDLVESLGNCSVLEIGAGGMYEATVLRDRGVFSTCAYHIIDISREVLEVGRKQLPEVDFRNGSVNKIPFEDNSFDVVYCRHVIEHQPLYEKPIQEMLRVSRKAVIVNVFRWTLGKTQIQRGKKYSNSYNVYDLLRFCKSSCQRAEHFILLKGEGPGMNMYSEPEVVRSGDHLLLCLMKGEDSAFSTRLHRSLDPYRENLIMSPYNCRPPAYHPLPKS